MQQVNQVLRRTGKRQMVESYSTLMPNHILRFVAHFAAVAFQLSKRIRLFPLVFLVLLFANIGMFKKYSKDS